MKTRKKQIDELNLELVFTVEAADYLDVERKKLSDVRRKADFKGFRKGNVPESLIKKIYGDQILAESVNQVLSQAISKYIDDHKLHILGEPLSSEKQQEIDWVSGSDFTFTFDVALSPEVSVDVVKEDVINQYSITASAKDKSEMVENLKKYYEKQSEDSKEEGKEASAPAKTDEEIAKEVDERLKEDYRQESEWRLNNDIKDFYVQKSGVKLPEEFLKRWLVYANEGKVSKEDVEKEFDGFAKDFKWQLVRGSLMKQFGFEIKPEDISDAAKEYIKYQYAMYGLPEVPENILGDAVKNILSDQKQVETLSERVEDQKVLSKIKESATIKSKKISSEKFREL